MNCAECGLVECPGSVGLPCSAVSEWSGSLDPNDPDNYWINDETGERVCAKTGERTKV